ncbi:hypothetical protein AB0O54_19965, partial [Pseudarthrobacter oxydans]|uniref:hypothetical protein n=1 Tax=Pseudarthrobacter oxydans TaxID=1671 RepID=UPI00343A41A1
MAGAIKVYRRRAWFALRFNQLLGVRWRGRLLGAAGPSQSSGPSSPVVYKRFLVAVLRILGVRSSP